MKKRLGYLLLTMAGFTAAFAAQPARTFADDPATTLRGYTEVDRIIHERIARTNGFELGQYLGDDSTQPSEGKLLALLGTYVGSDTNGGYRNGDPNSVNTLLWYIALSQFAQDIADTCNKPEPVPTPSVVPMPSSTPSSIASASPSGTPELQATAEASPSPSPSPSESPPAQLAVRPTFHAALMPLCKWPADSAKSDTALYNYYTALLSFDAPPEEFAAWKDYFLNNAQYANAPASTALPAMTLAALFNPYFLLRN